MLTDLKIKSVYKTDEDDILSDFYGLALPQCIKFDRAVGFFSAANIHYASQGISTLISGGGRIRFIIGAFVSHEDYCAVLKGYSQRNHSDLAESDIIATLKSFEDIDDPLFNHRLETLSWLIANRRVDIRIALRKQGMYHEKIGIMEDKCANKLIFTGSSNETPYGMLRGYNFESINVFKSWEDKADHWMPHIKSFERLWENQAKDTIVLDASNNIVERFLKFSNHASRPDPLIEDAIWKIYNNKPVSTSPNTPLIPTVYKGRPFNLKQHQTDAIHEWINVGFRGIFALATGAGKTITAIVSLAKLFNGLKRLVVIISVPYQSLADQWCEELKEFNIIPIQCYLSSSLWKKRFDDAIQHFNLGSRDFICAVVVNRTLVSKNFQQSLNTINGENLLFIGDECHHHGGYGCSEALPKSARFRMGLSATPDHWNNDERNEQLHSFYGDIIASYTLKQAIEDKVLTPYYYNIILVYLTEDEAEQYVDLSQKISRLMAIKNCNPDNSDDMLGILLAKRARILGSAKNKATALDSLLKSVPVQKHTLFYTGEGRADQLESSDSELSQLELLSRIIADHDWKFSHFTAAVDKKTRDAVLDHFKMGDIDALVSMRCLDEGVDIPNCRTAFILASSRDPRQFIQRRGRILRRANGKRYATIYDFVVCLPEGYDDGPSLGLLRNELSRVSEFANLSLNRADAYHILEPLLCRYNLLDLL